jgi:hypothetical protein
MSVIDQLMKNADWVRDNFGPESGLADFGYNSDSIAYIDRYIDRNVRGVRDQKALAKYISLLGAFVGEAVRARHGGEWIETDTFPMLQIQRGEMIHGVQPFGKVQKRIADGETDSLAFFFNDFVPAIVEGRAPPEWKAGVRKVEPNKPWWKVW